LGLFLSHVMQPFYDPQVQHGFDKLSSRAVDVQGGRFRWRLRLHRKHRIEKGSRHARAFFDQVASYPAAAAR
jgi:hypothetical protein